MITNLSEHTIIHEGYMVPSAYTPSVEEEIQEWLDSQASDPQIITNQAAYSIAAWYQEPYNSFSIFASSGKVAATFLADIEEEMYKLDAHEALMEGGELTYAHALMALQAHVASYFTETDNEY